MKIEIVYDRSTLVRATLRTVFQNLAEGGLLVVLVLLLMLGSLRAGLLVAASIPLSMLGATVAMVLLGVPGNLMSLGALDFGLVVNGAVVMVENLFHHLSGLPPLGGDGREARSAAVVDQQERISAISRGVARPVFFSVLIILLVYPDVGVILSSFDGRVICAGDVTSPGARPVSRWRKIEGS